VKLFLTGGCGLIGSALVRSVIRKTDHAEALLRALEHGEPGAACALGGRRPPANLQAVRVICSDLDRKLPDPTGQRLGTSARADA
jgi:dTDP-glucose 4,6-dehydratase